MHLETYLAETRQLAERQCAVLDQAAERLNNGEILNDLEENGVLHALQVMTENAIGKAKHTLKQQGHTVPISAYDTFHQLIALGQLPKTHQANWNAIIDLRNRIVHDYLNLDMSLVLQVIQTHRYHFIRDFLLADMPGVMPD